MLLLLFKSQQVLHLNSKFVLFSVFFDSLDFVFVVVLNLFRCVDSCINLLVFLTSYTYVQPFHFTVHLIRSSNDVVLPLDSLRSAFITSKNPSHCYIKATTDEITFKSFSLHLLVGPAFHLMTILMIIIFDVATVRVC